MDGSRFDRLVRDMLGSASRRGVLHLLGALPVVGGLASVVAGADARKGNGNNKNKNNGQDDDDDVAGEKNKGKRRKKKCKKRKRQACNGTCGTVTVKCKSGKKRKAKKKKVNCGPCGPTCQVCDEDCPSTTVQGAIDVAQSGDTIIICAGTFTGNIAIDKDLTLTGAGTDDTILQGDGTASVVVIDPTARVAIQDLTITGGNSADVGGGIANGGAETTLTGVTVTGNVATTRGGGIDIDVGGQVTLINSLVTLNQAGTVGGGIFTVGTLTLQDGTVVSNNEAAQSGGGVGIGSVGTVNVDGTSSVTDNQAETIGGGVHNAGEITCAAETIIDNQAGEPPATSNCIDDDGGTGCDTCSP